MNTITELDKTESNLEDPSLVTTQQADQSALTEKELDMVTDHKSEVSQVQREPEQVDPPQATEEKAKVEIKVPETVYRPPFKLPVVEEEAFNFVYD